MNKQHRDVRFGKFGTVSFTQTTRVNGFIDYLEKGKVMYAQCKNCGAKYFPPRADCSACLTSDTRLLEITGRAKLVSYSRLNYAPVGFDADLPYSIALVDYGDYQVFGRLDSNLGFDEVKIGMEMTTAANQLPNGQLNYIFSKA